MVCDPSVHLTQPGTIAAIATGAGAIGIIRVSGERSAKIGKQICGTDLTPRKAFFCQFRDQQGALIDEGIALFFKAPKSYTGEDVLELQGHGGKSAMQLLLDSTIEAGARHATPGEFSRRAVLNGKMSVYQAEAICDLIAASSQRAHRAALKSKEGVFATKIEELGSDLLKIRGSLEAAIDFLGDDEDTDSIYLESLQELDVRMWDLMIEARASRRLQQGVHIVLVGLPNVGKSSLYNALCRSEAAIVTDDQGTTRDLLHAELIWDDIHITLTDTAGIHEAKNKVEKEGVRRSLSIIEQADLVVLMLDDQNRCIPFEIEDQLDELRASRRLVLVYNKIDQSRKTEQNSVAGLICDQPQPTYKMSLKTHQGLSDFRAGLIEHLGFHDLSEHAYLATDRHIKLLKDAHSCIRKVLVESDLYLDQKAQELKEAQQFLGDVSNPQGSEALLDEIFSTFCIGK